MSIIWPIIAIWIVSSLPLAIIVGTWMRKCNEDEQLSLYGKPRPKLTLVPTT